MHSGAHLWQRLSAVLATLALALLVAAAIARNVPDFADMPVVAVVRDAEQHPIWTIRLARLAHQMGAETRREAPPPSGEVYQLWLIAPGAVAPRQLGLLPQLGRKRIAVSPENARLLAGAGELVVTLEPPGGSPASAPSGPRVLQATLDGQAR